MDGKQLPPPFEKCGQTPLPEKSAEQKPAVSPLTDRLADAARPNAEPKK